VQSRSEQESVCPFISFRLSSSVTHFFGCYSLASPYMSPGAIVMMGVCMLCLRTTHVSHFLMLSLLGSNYLLYVSQETAVSPSASNSQRGLMLKADKFERELCLAKTRFLWAFEIGSLPDEPISLDGYSGESIKPQSQSAKHTANLGHAKPHLHSRVCRRLAVEGAHSSPWQFEQAHEKPILDFSIQGLSFSYGIRAQRCDS
jgi:hypothetical protein